MRRKQQNQNSTNTELEPWTATDSLWNIILIITIIIIISRCCSSIELLLCRTYTAEQRVGTTVAKFKDRIIPAFHWRHEQQVAILVPVVVDVREVVELSGGAGRRRRIFVVVDHRHVLWEWDVLTRWTWHTLQNVSQLSQSVTDWHTLYSTYDFRPICHDLVLYGICTTQRHIVVKNREFFIPTRNWVWFRRSKFRKTPWEHKNDGHRRRSGWNSGGRMASAEGGWVTSEIGHEEGWIPSRKRILAYFEDHRTLLFLPNMTKSAGDNLH